MRRASYMSIFNFDEQRAVFLALILIITSALATSAFGAANNLRDGIWKSRGYGYLLQVEGDQLAVYDITANSCIKNEAVTFGFSAMRNALHDPFGSADDQLRIRLPFEHQIFHFDLLPAMPSACSKNMASDPLTTFDVFAEYFEEHYAFFDLYDVSWPTRVAKFRELVSPKTSEAELFKLLAELVAPLRDGHISIAAEFDGEEHAFEAYPGEVALQVVEYAEKNGDNPDAAFMGFVREYWLSGVHQEILGGKGEMLGNGYIQYGIVDEIGYVSVLAMGGFAGKDEFHEQEDLDVLTSALDDMLSRFEDQKVEAVVVDLSINFGGYDFIGRELARRFADAEYFAYSLRVGDKVGALDQPVAITPYDGLRHTGPVVLVTSSQTVSAAEISTMAFRALPNVQHVGMPTAGALSTTLNKQLPNGWNITLSNEIYTDHEGKLWESKGIPPHVELDIFGGDDLLKSHPNAIRELINLIKNGNI